MNTDEQDAIKALAHRLTEWGVDGAADKAKQYVGDLVNHGWRMAANEQRAIRRPPQKHEECATHPGEYSDFCRGCVADRKAAQDEAANGPRLSREDAIAAIREAVTTAATPTPTRPDFDQYAAAAVAADEGRMDATKEDA